MFLIVVQLLAAFGASNGAELTNCPKHQVTFEKIIGIRPTDVNAGVLLYEDKHGRPVALNCIEKCSENKDCLHFVLEYNTSRCYRFKHNVQEMSEVVVVDTDASWFVKTCLAHENCNKSWVFERIPGAVLVGSDTKTLPALSTRLQCQQACLEETSFNCKSAEFRTSTNDDEVLGRCVLSKSDRHLMTYSFRASRQGEEYLGNQCSKVSVGAFCSYEEYENTMLGHADDVHEETTKEECEHLCEKTEKFNCRGYTILPMELINETSSMKFQCFVHSEDSKIHGPQLLKSHPNATYYERASCINVTVSCSDTYMVVVFRPGNHFYGRIYTQSYSQSPECSAFGKEQNAVTLRIPLVEHHCGLVHAKDNLNGSLLSTNMIIQYNSVVQTQADRVVKVGCLYGNYSRILVGTGVNFTDNYPRPGTSIVNSTPNPPQVKMHIADYYTHKEVSSTQIGQELQLIIEMTKSNDHRDIWAGHLVAMTENAEDSIVLLDDRGCPTNLNVFPPLTKISNNNTIKLIATFQAFKFSSSTIMRFSVILQFCSQMCDEVECGSYVDNRIKRSLEHAGKELLANSTVTHLNVTEFKSAGKQKVQEFPLEFVITVRETNPPVSDKQIYGENRLLIAEYDYNTNKVCINYVLLIGLIILWVLIQVIFLLSGICIIQKYKKIYEEKCVHESLEELHRNHGFGYNNLDNRRVHFAENSNFN